MAINKSILTAATVTAGLAAVLGLKNKEKSNLNIFGTSLYFPNDLGTDRYPYYISFAFREYQRRSMFDRVFFKDVGMIRLPIPNQLVDSNEVQYKQEASSLITGAAVEGMIAGSSKMSEFAAKQESMIGNIASTIGGAGGTAAGAAIGAAARLTVGSNLSTSGFRDQVLQLAGVAQNPFLTVLFNSPSYKRHQFTWTMNPSNEKESATLRAIVNKFKYHQLPDISGASAGTLLTYPDMVIVGLYPDSKYLYDFKPCVIENFSVNYSSDGQPAFFGRTDAPVTATIQISLLEIEFWTKSDILLSQGVS